MKEGKVFYGLHFAEGVAEYKDSVDEGGKPLMIFINSDTAKKMDSTFPGKPVFVDHIETVDAETFKEADGYVVESFFNKADGRHWAKFIVTTEAGEQAIKNGWKLSNAYFKMKEVGGGRWHGVDYDKEVVEAEYDHLAIVDNPRYEESIILTPDEFKKYNSEKDQELYKLANSIKPKKEKKGMLKFFKRERMDNSADLENLMVVLPRTKKEILVSELVANADKEEEVMANGDQMVKVGEDEMSVNELVEKYEQMLKAKNEEEDKKEDNEDEDEDKSANEEEDKKEENEDEDKEENEEEYKEENEEEYKEENEEDEEEEKAKNSLFEDLDKAELKAKNSYSVIETSEDKVARGASRYGSK